MENTIPSPSNSYAHAEEYDVDQAAVNNGLSQQLEEQMTIDDDDEILPSTPNYLCTEPSHSVLDPATLLDDTITIPRSYIQIFKLHIAELQKDVKAARDESARHLETIRKLTTSQQKLPKKTSASSNRNSPKNIIPPERLGAMNDIHKKMNALQSQITSAQAKAKQDRSQRMAEMNKQMQGKAKECRTLTTEKRVLQQWLDCVRAKLGKMTGGGGTISSHDASQVDQNVKVGGMSKKRKAEDEDDEMQDYTNATKRLKSTVGVLEKNSLEFEREAIYNDGAEDDLEAGMDMGALDRDVLETLVVFGRALQRSSKIFRILSSFRWK